MAESYIYREFCIKNNIDKMVDKKAAELFLTLVNKILSTKLNRKDKSSLLHTIEHLTHRFEHEQDKARVGEGNVI